MLHREKDDLMPKQMKLRRLPVGSVGLRIQEPHFHSPASFAELLFHRLLQRLGFGPPPCQQLSVVGVIEVGALSTEAAAPFAAA